MEGLIVGGSTPRTLRDFALLLAESAMTVWFADNGIPISRLEEGMAEVRKDLEKPLADDFPSEMAPPVDPVLAGMNLAHKAGVNSDSFPPGQPRDYDAIVKATEALVIAGVVSGAFASAIHEDLLKLL